MMGTRAHTTPVVQKPHLRTSRCSSDSRDLTGLVLRNKKQTNMQSTQFLRTPFCCAVDNKHTRATREWYSFLGGSWGLSKWFRNGDNWGIYMACRGYTCTILYLLSPPGSPSIERLQGSSNKVASGIVRCCPSHRNYTCELPDRWKI